MVSCQQQLCAWWGKIDFSSDRDGDKDLYTKKADGSGKVQQITHNHSRDVEPDWQPVK